MLEAEIVFHHSEKTTRGTIRDVSVDPARRDWMMVSVAWV